MKKLLIPLLIIMFTWVALNAGTVTWDSREHYYVPLSTHPNNMGFKIHTKPSLGPAADAAGAAGAQNDIIFGPFSLSGLPQYPHSVCILMRAHTWSTTYDTIEGNLTFECQIDSVVPLATTDLTPITRYKPVNYTDSGWVKFDSIAIVESLDSIYPGLSTLNGGEGIIFEFPPATKEWRLFYDADVTTDSVLFWEMYINYVT